MLQIWGLGGREKGIPIKITDSVKSVPKLFPNLVKEWQCYIHFGETVVNSLIDM